ncbi:MAG: sugar phosphate isomerase/epimerase [Lentisphaeria bacterium]|nr:sugar phosphate isomerase/epimerase [Lentisphaeria bacterium]
MKFGVQLYNFREALQKDFRGTLKEVAKLGFDGVEFPCMYGNIPPEELAEYLKELKLECCGAMFSKEALLEENGIAYQYAAALKTPAVTLSLSCDFTQEWKNVADICRRIGDIAAANKTLFSYHNHWREFELVENTPAMDLILKENDAQKVFMEPDVCWLTRGGIKPAEFISRYASRIRQIHMKDSKVPDVVAELTELGNGIVDLKGAFLAAQKADIPWLIYEQDVSKDPFRSAEISLKYLKNL